MTLNFALNYLYSNNDIPKVETTVITFHFCTNNITAKKIGHFKKQNVQMFSSSFVSLTGRTVNFFMPCFISELRVSGKKKIFSSYLRIAVSILQEEL